MSGGKVIAIIAAIVGIIAGGIAIYQFISPEPPPPDEPSFLEKVSGSYVLASWVQAHRPVELGIEIPEGTLEVGTDGIMNWSVLLQQTYTANPGRVRMTARGRIQVGSQKVLGIQGGQYNNTQYLDNRWGQVSSDVVLAIRGWSSGQPEDAFQMSIDEGGGGSLLLQMSNSRGTFTWRKH